MLSYQCPHCQQRVSVDASLLGSQVDCPSCDRPFVADAPIARAAAGEPSRSDREVHAPADHESTLKLIHPVVFRRHFFGTLVSLVLLIAGVAALLGFGPVAAAAYLTIVGGVLVVIALIFLAKWFILSRTTSLTLTNERIVYREGIINTKTSEVRHKDVRNIRVNRNLIERLLNFGDISLSSAGQDDMEIVIHDIPDPEGVAQFIRERQ
jgi:hypothetical protein